MTWAVRSAVGSAVRLRLSHTHDAHRWSSGIQVTSFENLLRAYRKARRGKGGRSGVAEFGLNLERELLALRRELQAQTYRPGDYRLFTIYERKPRVIAAAPFRDRVVHHAVMQANRADSGPDVYFRFLCLPEGQGGSCRGGSLFKPGRRPIGMS